MSVKAFKARKQGVPYINVLFCKASIMFIKAAVNILPSSTHPLSASGMQ